MKESPNYLAMNRRQLTLLSYYHKKEDLHVWAHCVPERKWFQYRRKCWHYLLLLDNAGLESDKWLEAVKMSKHLCKTIVFGTLLILLKDSSWLDEDGYIKTEMGCDGNIKRYNVRVVIKGYTQHEGIYTIRLSRSFFKRMTWSCYDISNPIWFRVASNVCEIQ